MATDTDKKKADMNASDGPVTGKHLKEANLLLKGVAKFLRYNDDLISDQKKELIKEKEAAFREGMVAEGLMVKDLEALAGDLTQTCEKSVSGYKVSAMRENVEVIFVAVVIAMGIRAYFAQPFKIPTGSMQPTLNGVIGHPDQSLDSNHEYVTDQEMPGILGRVADRLWYGRSWVNEVAQGDEIIHVHPVVDNQRRVIGGFREVTKFKFFTYTYIPVGVDPLHPDRVIKIPGTSAKVRDLLNPKLFSNPSVKQGETIAKGFVDTGDQVIVDKFSYHWIAPKRGDVFVFTTNDIPYIQSGLPDPRMGSQHYIKRLAGEPGDHLQVKDGKLFINGEVAEEFGFQRVMSGENGYRGYSNSGSYRDVQLESDQYFALGDNSYNSSDGRTWGPVPQRNIVGRALMVYLPLGHHFGRIR